VPLDTPFRGAVDARISPRKTCLGVGSRPVCPALTTLFHEYVVFVASVKKKKQPNHSLPPSASSALPQGPVGVSPAFLKIQQQMLNQNINPAKPPPQQLRPHVERPHHASNQHNSYVHNNANHRQQRPIPPARQQQQPQAWGHNRRPKPSVVKYELILLEQMR